MTIVGDIEAVVPQARLARVMIAAIGVVILAIVLGFAAWWVFLRPASLERSAAQAKVDATAAGTSAKAATDAIPVINEAARQRVEVDVKVQKGEIDVHAQPDAGTAIAGVSAAVLRGLCLHDDLYAGDGTCQSLHEDPSGVGPARSDDGRTGGAD